MPLAAASRLVARDGSRRMKRDRIDTSIQVCMFCREPLRLRYHPRVTEQPESDAAITESWDCENPACITNRKKKNVPTDT